MKYLTYNPEQGYLLPPSVRDILGETHVCFFVHQAVERLELSAFEQGYVEEGRPAYHPALLLKVAIVEPGIGVLKEQRGMRQFRRRGLGKVAVEFALAATAFNLTRLWRNKPKLDQEG